ncbi:MAG TPA: gamma carbonic anhydrase family protein [Anaerovoracaceae bacterium]|nr:gamma carbonic anhydrase family protein [Anaerovoracaceae bacterium]
MIKNLQHKKVAIHSDVFIAETAVVVGDVSIGEDSSLWYGAAVRGDLHSIEIGKATNVQDNATLHVDRDAPLKIGDFTSIGHNAIVHGCQIGSNCLIGMGAIIMSNAVIGDNSIIAAGALVTESTVIPPNSLVMGTPGKVVRQITEDDIIAIKNTAIRYRNLWKSEYI